MGGSLRQQAVRGSIYLTVRRGVSMILGLLGLLLLTRIVGPAAYGVFNAAYGVFNYLLFIGLMSVHVYLIRAEGNENRALFDVAFWWLLLYGVAVASVAALAILGAGALWVRTEGFVPVALLLCANLPLTLISYVPLALLERRLAYHAVASVEIISQLAYYATAIPMAWAGYGVWSLVAGFWVGQLVLPLGFFGVTRYCPQWRWRSELLRPMLGYGFTHSLSSWVYNLRELAPSLILLPLAGKEAAGYLALVNRFLNMLSFVKDAAGRISIPVFARVQHDLERLARAVSEAMQLQTLALGVFLTGFTLVAPWMLPALLGNQWEVKTLLLAFAWAGTRILLSALFAIQGSALVVKGYNWLMLRANLAYAVVFLGLCYGLLPWLPAEDRLAGFLIADLAAHVPTYVYKHWGMTRFVRRPDYRVTVLWTMAMLCALFAPLTYYWLYAASALLLFNPLSVRQLRVIINSLRSQQRGAAS